MGKIKAAYLMPHPPIVLKEVGKGEEKKAQNTIDGMMTVAKDIKEQKPKVIILITPHGPLFQDAMAISIKPELKGDMGKFEAEEVKFVKENHLPLVNRIIQFAGMKNIVCAQIDQDFAKEYDISSELDHGAMVPLYFVDKEYIHYRLVHITYGLLPLEELYTFGKAVQYALEEMDEDAVVIASGDLSHRLTKEAPAGYDPNGKVFDETLIKLLEEGRIEDILAIDKELANGAGECGLRSIVTMLGACDGYDIYPEIISYEGPFGVGYGVEKMSIGSRNRDKGLVDKLYKNREERIEKIRKREDEYVKLARKALETHIRDEIEIEEPKDIKEELIENQAGVFVSLKKHGELRGCIGTIHPSKENIAKEIIKNAIHAGTEDPRFYPVEEDELSDLVYSVDILKKPEVVNGLEDLDIEKYGVIVTSGKKSGLLLPHLDNIHSVEEQVRIALQKAGIRPNEGYNLQRFEVVRHK